MLFENGDYSKAVKLLYNSTWKLVKGYVLKHGGSSAEAEDLFQDGIMKLFLRIRDKKMHPGDNIEAYLFTMIKNGWLNKVKKDKRIQLVDDMIHLDKNNIDETKDFYVLKAKVVNESLTLLGETCRELLKMTFYMGKSLAEASEILEMKNSTVAKSTQYRCKKKLQKILKDNVELKEIMNI